jgi:hypothetical protein
MRLAVSTGWLGWLKRKKKNIELVADEAKRLSKKPLRGGLTVASISNADFAIVAKAAIRRWPNGGALRPAVGIS